MKFLTFAIATLGLVTSLGAQQPTGNELIPETWLCWKDEETNCFAYVIGFPGCFGAQCQRKDVQISVDPERYEVRWTCSRKGLYYTNAFWSVAYLTEGTEIGKQNITVGPEIRCAETWQCKCTAKIQDAHCVPDVGPLWGEDIMMPNIRASGPACRIKND